MPRPRRAPWRHDSRPTASDKPGAVHAVHPVRFKPAGFSSWPSRDRRPKREATRPTRAAAGRTISRRFWEQRRPAHLLTGKVVCGGCGKAFAAVGRDWLACRLAQAAGPCANRARLRRAPLEAAVPEALAKRLMEPALDGDIDAAVRGSPAWREAEDLLKSVPGVGDVTPRAPSSPNCPSSATSTAAASPPCRRRPRQPRQRADARPARHRRRQGQRAQPALHVMTTLVAIRWNPVIKAHYRQMIARGRPKKVAVIACLRRLLGMLNAILKSRSPWHHA
jgi:hypothetical protein